MSAVVVPSNNNHDHPHTPNPVFDNSPTFQMACRQLDAWPRSSTSTRASCNG